MDNQSIEQAISPQPAPQGGTASRITAMLAVAICLGLMIYFWPRIVSSFYEPRSATPQLRTGGTAAVLVVAENFWKGKYLKEQGVDLVCESVGTTQGTTGMLDGVYSIAFTHDPASTELRERAKKNGVEIVHVPLMLCGVAPAYHFAVTKGKEPKDEKPLNFTGEVLARIFLGKITQWNDPALKKINPGVKLPDKKIIVVHREDSSGTTQIFTEYLAAASPEWREQMGPGSDRVKWPTGVGELRNQGVAIKVHGTDGAIGYVDRMYVTLQDLSLDYGAVQNHDKTAFVRAEAPNTTAALQAILAEIPDDLTFSLADKPGKDSYPIAGVIYAQCSDVQPAAKRQQVVDFLRWAVHEDAQKSVAQASFAPLPPELIPRIDKRLEGIKAGK